MPSTLERQRTWTEVGAEYVERLGGREEIESEIAGLDWQEIPKSGSLTVGMIPGSSINAAIRELRIPKVSAVAIGSFDRPGTGGNDGFYPGFYGIVGNYKNGRAWIYVLDVGTEIIPLCSELLPAN